MASELLLPTELISNVSWLKTGGPQDDLVTVVADEFGGVETGVSTLSETNAIEYGFAAPTGQGPIARVDVKAEAIWGSSPRDLEVNLWIAGAWQGVRAVELSDTWQVYTFGGWMGIWTPQQVAESKFKLTAAAAGKNAIVAVATLRQVITYKGAGGRMLLTGVGP